MIRKLKLLLWILLFLVAAVGIAVLNLPAIVAFAWKVPDYLTSLAMLMPLKLEAGSMMPRGGSFEFMTVDSTFAGEAYRLSKSQRYRSQRSSFHG
jgi:hypothetical protein